MDAEESRPRHASAERLSVHNDSEAGPSPRTSLSRRSPTPSTSATGQTRGSSTSLPNGTGHVSHPSPTAHSAASSLPPQLETFTAPADTTAADVNSAPTSTTPYGTRSRNRTGGSRPNYAEDHEMDVDDERHGVGNKPANSRKAAPPQLEDTPPAEGDKLYAVNTRKGFSSANGPVPVDSSSAAAAKDFIPGTSSFSATPGVSSTSKKRKQPGGSITSAASSPPSHYTTAKPRASHRGYYEANMMTFENTAAYLKKGELIADDGTALRVNGIHFPLPLGIISTDSNSDHAYLVCEPPGEPYYLARIMQFLPTTGGAIESIRVNWYYRPRDIQRRVQDSRVVFASMHSDTCPLTSLRGKCQIRHVSEIDNLDDYRKSRDSFWYEKLYDRYMQRYYEIIPTSRVINVPKRVKKALDERWKFVLTEIGRTKELTRDVKTCKRCGDYAAKYVQLRYPRRQSTDSIQAMIPLIVPIVAIPTT